MFDKDEMRFKAEVIEISMRKFNASCEDKGSEDFLSKLYGEYQKDGRPKAVERWVTNRLRNVFVSVEEPPVWVEDEPSWPFFNGEPMVFISQTRLPRNSVTERKLTWDEVVYLFGARLDHGDGHIVEYRVVAQTIGL